MVEKLYFGPIFEHLCESEGGRREKERGRKEKEKSLINGERVFWTQEIFKIIKTKKKCKKKKKKKKKN